MYSKKQQAYHRWYYKKFKKKISKNRKKYYAKNKHRILARQKCWRIKNRTRKSVILSKEKWVKTNPKKVKEVSQNYRKRNVRKCNIRAKLNNAIKHGKFSRPEKFPCASCGKPAAEYHHYAGYSLKNWDKVMALCKLCHEDIDHGITALPKLSI